MNLAAEVLSTFLMSTTRFTTPTAVRILLAGGWIQTRTHLTKLCTITSALSEMKSEDGAACHISEKMHVQNGEQYIQAQEEGGTCEAYGADIKRPGQWAFGHAGLVELLMGPVRGCEKSWLTPVSGHMVASRKWPVRRVGQIKIMPKKWSAEGGGVVVAMRCDFSIALRPCCDSLPLQNCTHRNTATKHKTPQERIVLPGFSAQGETSQVK
jgi:hypothetical protein